MKSPVWHPFHQHGLGASTVQRIGQQIPDGVDHGAAVAVDQQRLVETDAVFLVTADVKLAHGVYGIGVDIVARGEGEVLS